MESCKRNGTPPMFAAPRSPLWVLPALSLPGSGNPSWKALSCQGIYSPAGYVSGTSPSSSDPAVASSGTSALVSSKCSRASYMSAGRVWT